jgi:hypothetical protein
MFTPMRVTETIGPAWERMKALLFRPFNAGTWFSFGFIFFLQSCVEGSGSSNFNIPSGNSGGGGGSGYGGSSSGGSSDSILTPFTNLMHGSSGGLGNLGGAEVALILVIALVITIPLLILIYWLGARGQMMAIRAVAWGDGNVGMNWNQTQSSGSRFFKFHLVMAGIALAVFLPLLGVGAVLMIPAIERHEGFDALLVPIILIAVVAFIAMIPLAIVDSLGRNFVAPIMVKHELGARDAWKRFWAVGRNHVGGIFVFFILKFLFSLLAALAGMIGGFLTCCLGFLPVLHQTLMAPWYVFERAWTLEILASMDPDFDLRAAIPGQYPPGGYGPPGGFGPPGGGGYGPPGGDYNPYAPPAGGYGGGPQGGWGPPGGGGGPAGGGGPSGGGGPPPGGWGPPGGYGGPQGGGGGGYGPPR